MYVYDLCVCVWVRGYLFDIEYYSCSIMIVTLSVWVICANVTTIMGQK